MFKDYPTQFPMERVTALNIIHLFRLFVHVVQVFLFNEVIDRVRQLYRSLSRSNYQNKDFDDTKKPHIEEKEKIQGFEPIEQEQVMARLGIFLDPKGGKIGFGDGFTSIFEENEPSLEEVKGAFDVFDENGDGFVDERELQRVLCNLGLKEGLEMQNCRGMISRYDENGDERIDFKEFMKVMENTFY